MYNDKKGLPPKPFVKRGKNGKYIAIDGHNLLVVSDLFDGECEALLVENSRDFLTDDRDPDVPLEAIADRNRELIEKFETADVASEQVEKEGMCSITDLRKSIPYLENISDAREFLKGYLQKDHRLIPEPLWRWR